MKISEFVKRAEEMGYIITHDSWCTVVLGQLANTVYAKISSNYVNELFLNTGQYPLVKLCIEYAETPLAEREEEKRYTVRIPDSPERTPVYALCKLVNGCVVINQTNESNFQEHDRYRLTETEIKRNHEYLWQFAKEVSDG